MSDTSNVCIFCLYHHDHITEPTGKTCSYMMHHEFPVVKEKQQVKKVDKQVCTQCGLHSRNPASATNGCAHQYPQE